MAANGAPTNGSTSWYTCREEEAHHLAISELLERFPDPVHLCQILRDRYGLVATGAVQSFKAVAAVKSDAAPLGLRTGDPITVWHGIRPGSGSYK